MLDMSLNTARCCQCEPLTWLCSGCWCSLLHSSLPTGEVHVWQLIMSCCDLRACFRDRHALLLSVCAFQWCVIVLCLHDLSIHAATVQPPESNREVADGGATRTANISSCLTSCHASTIGFHRFSLSKGSRPVVACSLPFATLCKTASQ